MEEHLSKVVNSYHRDWDEYLPLFLIAYRSVVHNTTNFIPGRIVFGKELRLPYDLLIGTPNRESRKVHDYSDQLLERLLEVYDVVRE